MMQTIYRALYTRCINGINFQKAPSLREGQKMFSTSGNMGLPMDVLSFLETEIGRDVYSSGMRSYRGEVYRFFSCGGMSVLIQYRWMQQEETGSREFGIAKALIGVFERHPAEYFSSGFFNGKEFFSSYPDAEGKEITSFRQLLTFQGGKVPPPFPPLTGESLFSYDSYPVMSFENAGRYILQSEKVAERLRAAVSHLVRQFGLPDNQRKGIIIRGTREQIRYWFAAIGYAFSIRSAQKISFSIGLPPLGFSYDFATSALTGWVTNRDDPCFDPDFAKSGDFVPVNLIYLENLPAADSHGYYSSCIGKFNKIHQDFIMEFLKRRDDEVQSYPSLCADFSEVLRLATKETGGEAWKADLRKCKEVVSRYDSGDFFRPSFWEEILRGADNVVIRQHEDILCLIQMYSILERIIKKDTGESGGSHVDTEKAGERFQRSYVRRFKGIFTDILSGDYQFCNEISAREPMEYFNELMKQNLDYAYRIANEFIGDKDSFERYSFSMEFSKTGKDYLAAVVYPRIRFLFYLMEWCGESGKYLDRKEIFLYICRAFEAVLIQYELGSSQAEGGITIGEYAEVYKKIFAPNPASGLHGFCDDFDIDLYRNCGYSPKKIEPELYDSCLGQIFLSKYDEDFAKAGENRSGEIHDRCGEMKKLLKNLRSRSRCSEEDLYRRCFDRIHFGDKNNVYYYAYIEEYVEDFSQYGKNYYWRDVWKLLVKICQHPGRHDILKKYGVFKYDQNVIDDMICSKAAEVLVLGLINGGNWNSDRREILLDIEEIIGGNIYTVHLQPLLTALGCIGYNNWLSYCDKIDAKIDVAFESALEEGKDGGDIDSTLNCGSIKSLAKYSESGVFYAVTRMNFYVDFCNYNKGEKTFKKMVEPYLKEGRIKAFEGCSKIYKDALEREIMSNKAYLAEEFLYFFKPFIEYEEKFCQEILSKILEKGEVKTKARRVGFNELYSIAKESGDNQIFSLILAYYDGHAKKLEKELNHAVRADMKAREKQRKKEKTKSKTYYSSKAQPIGSIPGSQGGDIRKSIDETKKPNKGKRGLFDKKAK